jgi:copper transport protein
VSGRARSAVVLATVGVALIAAGHASAHAYLVRTSPVASRTLSASPASVALTYNEPVASKFAIVSVTDADGHRVTSGSPHSSASDPRQLVTPLQRLPSGWYLVFWRVISADGHPVRGAFTFAVGPSPGPAPQFVVPSLSETATTPRLLVTRWIVFLAVMSALGLYALRIAIARPIVQRVRTSSLRAVSIAFGVALGVALLATPLYVLFATSQFALLSVFDLGAIVPLARDSSFGRDYLDLELVLGLFAVAAAASIWLDRPQRRERSVAGLLSLGAAVAAAGAVILVPALAGHAGQKSPRGLALPLDALHLAAVAIWVGGLIGIVVLWMNAGATTRVETLRVVVPRFSRVAFASVLVLIGSGIGQSLLELPTLATLWDTSYGKALIYKIVLLAAALVLAAVNLARTKPRLERAGVEPSIGPGAAMLLRRLVQGEIVFVVGALFAASVLASLAPPSPALAHAGKAVAHVGPGVVSRTVNQSGYRLRFRIAPNRAATQNSFSVAIDRQGRPVRRADVVTRFEMLDMSMGTQSVELAEHAPGSYARSAPSLVMAGHWGLTFEIAPPGKQPFTVVLLDKASG